MITRRRSNTSSSIWKLRTNWTTVSASAGRTGSLSNAYIAMGDQKRALSCSSQHLSISKEVLWILMILSRSQFHRFRFIIVGNNDFWLTLLDGMFGWVERKNLMYIWWNNDGLGSCESRMCRGNVQRVVSHLDFQRSVTRWWELEEKSREQKVAKFDVEERQTKIQHVSKLFSIKWTLLINQQMDFYVMIIDYFRFTIQLFSS